MKINYKKWLLGSLVASSVLLGSNSFSYADASWSQGAVSTPASSTADCSADVQRAQAAAQQQAIAGQLQLANQVYPQLQPGAFRSLSCLDNLLSGGLNILFNPPSIDALINMFAQAVCSAAQNAVASVEQPIFSALSSNVGTGQIIPGLNLGSIISTGRSYGPSSIIYPGGRLSLGSGSSGFSQIQSGLFGN